MRATNVRNRNDMPLAMAAGAILWAVLASAFPIAASAAESSSDEAASKAAFLEAYKVLMHPRCMNCHPTGDVPLQGDDSHLHAQNVKRGPDGKGFTQ
jgi:hypothetical protein